MRFGLVVYDGLDETTGGYVYDRRLVAALRERGHPVRVVDLPRRSYGRRLLDNHDAELLERLASADVDVLLQDELCHPSLVGHNRRLATPVVAVVHHLRCREPWPARRRELYRAVERRYLETVDAFVYNGATTRSTVEELVGPTDGVVAPPAGDRFDPDADPDRIEARAHDPGPLRVAFVGSVVPRKGLDTLVEGLARLDPGRWSLTAVGDLTADGAYADRVSRLVGELDVAESVELAGRLPDRDLAAVLRRSHLLAVPSAYEGFGIAYLEGMSFGLPAVASSAGGANEFVTDGENGFLVPPGDPGAVAAAVRSVAGDRDLLADMGRAARATYEAHTSWEATVDDVEAFLRTLDGGTAQ